MKNGRDIDLLGLFPSFESPVFGGVQASGREAWRSIAGDPRVAADAFYYQPERSRLATVCAAVRRRVQVKTVLVWHCGLLRLTPLIVPRKARLVLFLHGIEAWKKQDFVTTHLMRRTDLFLTNSDHTWQRFADVHPFCAAAAHLTVHLGTGERPGILQRPPGDRPAGLMIGRLSKTEDYKGHREIIQIWPRVLQCIPDAELWVVGEGDLRPELEQLARRLGLSPRHVRFFGVIPDRDKDDLLGKCRAMLMPSTGEGFGLVYLEAMRAGRPCLVSTLDAGTEVVNPPEAGLAADPANPDQILNCVLKLLTPGEDWDSMSASARRRYESRFTARHFGQRLTAALFDA